MFDLFFAYFGEVGDGERTDMPISELLPREQAHWSLLGLLCGGGCTSLVLHAVLSFFPHT